MSINRPEDRENELSAATERVRSAGKVIHDSRGTAIWDWAVATGVLAAKTAAELISTLDEPGELEIAAEASPLARDWSGDPYNRPHR
jgi:hypothetical protein